MKKSKTLVTVHNHCIETVYGDYDDGNGPREIWCKCGEVFTAYILHADHVVMKLFDAEDEEKDK
jgi:hypothetical protein